MSSREIEDVLSFWFGELDAGGSADKEHTKRWFTKDPAFDAQIVERFGSLHEEVARGKRDEWLASARGRLAFVIVLDQFSRNMFRGDPKSFATDARALEAALLALDKGDDETAARDERSFLYMPLMHSEDPAHQDRCVKLFAALCDAARENERAGAANALKYAHMHRDIVHRFGRFPHRNAVLGRRSTPEEVEFLKGEGSSF